MASNRREDPVLATVCSHWHSKLEQARKHKMRVFQEDADEAMSFYNGPKDWAELMGTPAGISNSDGIPRTTFKMNVNKAFELVTIFGPALYYQVPYRTVKPRTPATIDPSFLGNPMLAQSILGQEQIRLGLDALRASVLEQYLNWTPRENHLDVESRDAIEEALIKGRGCLWTELKTIPGSTMRVVSSTFDSVDDLYIDPDATSLEHATWIAKRCVHPVWQVESDYGLPPGSLKGNMESQAMQSEVREGEDEQYDRRRGLTNDLLVYFKIYSRMGIGGRLSGIARGLRGPLEMFGDFVFLVVAKDVPYPLNLPPSLQQEAGEGGPPQEVFDAVAWPTPYWADNQWPVTVLDFHRVPKSPWPMSHLRSGIGELKFLNWTYSFIAGKIRTTCRDFIAIKKSAGEEIKATILEGDDLTLIELEEDHGTITDVVGFLQHPQMNGDIWKVIQAVEANFDKRVGLSDLMYGDGGSTQIRSAQEAEVRNKNSNVRPEDMAKQVEAWMAEVASKEAICARWHLSGQQDIKPVMGDLASLAWDQYVHTTDLDQVTRQLEYEIEAGSARRPNKDTMVAQTAQTVQTILPLLQTVAQTTGNVAPLNNLLADWAKARDIDPGRYQIPGMMPPAPPVEAPPAA